MAPLSNNESALLVPRTTVATFGNWRGEKNPEAYVVESWGEGFMFGALLIMSCITISNMRRGVLLHKLILLEVRSVHFPRFPFFKLVAIPIFDQRTHLPDREFKGLPRMKNFADENE